MSTTQEALNSKFGKASDYEMRMVFDDKLRMYRTTETQTQTETQTNWVPMHINIGNYPRVRAHIPLLRPVRRGEKLYTSAYKGHIGGKPWTPKEWAQIGKKWPNGLVFICQFVKDSVVGADLPGIVKLFPSGGRRKLILVFAGKNCDDDPIAPDMHLCPGNLKEVFEFDVSLEELQEYEKSRSGKSKKEFATPTFVIDGFNECEELQSVESLMIRNNFPRGFRDTLAELHSESEFTPNWGIKFGGTAVYCQYNATESSTRRLLFQYSETPEIPFRFGDSGVVRVWENFADETGADETGADETGADETGADETGADEAGDRYTVCWDCC